MRRGSKLFAEKIVSTTTAPKVSAPGPASMTATDWMCTSATSTVTTKMSSIDQRPMKATIAYSRERNCGRHADFSCTEMARNVSTTSLVIGTTMLATNTIVAVAHEPVFHR